MQPSAGVPTECPLPEWDLGDLYAAPDCPELEQDLVRAEKEARKFLARYRERLNDLDGDALGDAIGEYEDLQEILHKVSSYAQLWFAGDLSDPARGRFYQGVEERVKRIASDGIFFALELNQLDENALSGKIENTRAERYAPWLRDLRAFRPHQLTDELERFICEKSVVGRSALIRLFEETLADLRFPMDGKSLTLSDTLNLLSDKKAKVRKKAAQALGKVLKENLRLFVSVTNTLAKDKEIEDRWRQYEHPVSSRNLANKVEDNVVEALVDAVRSSYEDLSHRYYALKAGWFGVEALDYWDRNAPMPDAGDHRYSWDEARALVLDAYRAFDPEMADIAKRFFDNAWIDAKPRPGKESGAFSHPSVPSVHPYVLMNFHGKSRDVMTLAHELGHGVHQILAAGQGTLMADTPLVLAETASVFGEMLTFRAMVDGETDAKRRRVLLAGKVEDMLNTVVRQIAFHQFEEGVHAARRKGELSAERLGDIWMETQKNSLGPSICFDDNYSSFWAYIPHFVHTPFYVYAYAFGDCLVNALYQVFRQGHPDFRGKYMDLLRAGGSVRHKELLAPFGLDASKPEFWRNGLQSASGFIDELEAMG
jgi:oligoendopeptidase F